MIVAWTSNITCYVQSKNSWITSRGPLEVDYFVNNIFQRSGSEFIFGFVNGLCFKMDSKLTKILNQRETSIEVDANFLDSSNNLIVIVGFKIFRFNEQKEGFDDLDQYVTENQVLNVLSQVCHHFTDSRRFRQGGRCIFSTRVLTILIDFNNLDSAAEGNLVASTRYLWVPTFP